MNRFSKNRLLACFLLFALLFVAVGCSKTYYLDPITSFTIYHTNDVHGYAAEEKDEKGTLTRLGYPRLKTLVDEDCFAPRNDSCYKILVDAGDSFFGQPLVTARRGEFAAQLLLAVGYDALAVGNHEFDYGLPRLLELRDKYQLPFIAANVTYKDSGQLVFPPYIVVDGVGFVGVSSPETPTSTSPGNVLDLNFSDGDELLAQVRAAVNTLKNDNHVAVVVALTHLGTEPFIEHNAQWLAKNIPGLDIIIDGHSHSEVRDMKVGDTIITSTGAYFTHVGNAGLWFGRSDYNWYASLTPAADLAEVKPDPKIARLIKNMQKELAKDMAVVMGRTPIELDGQREHIRTGSTNLGRLITTAMMKYTGAEAAIFNSGSIRASIPAGDITRGKLLEVLPYSNYAVTVKLTGAELREVMRLGLSSPGSGGFLQFSGLTVTRSGGSISSIKINDKPLNDRTEYVIAINDFMNEGGDGYDILKKTPLGHYETVDEMLLKYLTDFFEFPLAKTGGFM